MLSISLLLAFPLFVGVAVAGPAAAVTVVAMPTPYPTAWVSLLATYTEFGSSF